MSKKTDEKLSLYTSYGLLYGTLVGIWLWTIFDLYLLISLPVGVGVGVGMIVGVVVGSATNKKEEK